MPSSHHHCKRMLADGPPAMPPGKTGDVEVGDTITGYLWRFRELDTFGSPGCLVQDGERALLQPGGSQLIPLLTDLLPQKTCLSPCPYQAHIPEGTERVQSPCDATRRAMSSMHTPPQPNLPKPLLPFPVPAQAPPEQGDGASPHAMATLSVLICQRKEKAGIISMQNFLNSFQVKIKVIFKPTAEAPAITGSSNLQASRPALLKYPSQKSLDLHAGVKGLWWNISTSRSAPVADIVLPSESLLIESFSSHLFWLLPWLRFLMVKAPAS